MISEKRPRRRAYLLRCWEERGLNSDAPGVWRFSLEEASTGERRGFGSLEALVTYLCCVLTDEASQQVGCDPLSTSG